MLSFKPAFSLSAFLALLSALLLRVNVSSQNFFKCTIYIRKAWLPTVESLQDFAVLSLSFFLYHNFPGKIKPPCCSNLSPYLSLSHYQQLEEWHCVTVTVISFGSKKTFSSLQDLREVCLSQSIGTKLNHYKNESAQQWGEGWLGASWVTCLEYKNSFVVVVQSHVMFNSLQPHGLCSTPGFPVLHCLLEFAQTHVHWVIDAIQPSHPRLLHPPPAFNLSLHQGLF